MKIQIYLALAAFSVSVANAELTKQPPVIKIQISGGSKAVQVFGRSVPEVGAFQVQISEVKGRVHSVLLQPGDRVKKGAPLLKYSGGNCKSQSFCTVEAAFDGVLNEVLKTSGSEVDVGDGLVSILNPQNISVRLDVPTKYLKFLSVGQILKMRSPDLKGSVFDARVVEIFPALGVGETTRGVRLTPLSPLAGLRQDSVVNADVSVPLPGSGIRVPAKAVAFSNGRHFVIKKSDQNLQAVPVQILSETSEFLWVSSFPESPLKTGDTLLAEGVIFYLPRAMETKAN